MKIMQISEESVTETVVKCCIFAPRFLKKKSYEKIRSYTLWMRPFRWF